MAGAQRRVEAMKKPSRAGGGKPSKARSRRSSRLKRNNESKAAHDLASRAALAQHAGTLGCRHRHCVVPQGRSRSVADNAPDLLSQSLTGRASTSLGPRCGSPEGGPARTGAHNAMQRRCAEPRRRHRFRWFSSWLGSSTGCECGSGANQTAKTAVRILIA
jgi:hypothetical protein